MNKRSPLKTISIFFITNPTIAITVLSALGYIYAYAYNLGIYRYFGVSADYIDLTLLEILKFFPCVVFSLVFFAGTIGAIMLSIGDSKTWRISKVFIVCAYPLMFIQFFLRIALWLNYVVLALVVVFIIIEFLPKSNTESNEALVENVEEVEQPKIRNRIFYYSILTCFTGLLIVLTTFLFGVVGYSTYTSEQNYWQFADRANLIIVKKSEKTFICKSFDPKSYTIGDSLYIISADNVHETTIVLRHLGHLKRGKYAKLF